VTVVLRRQVWSTLTEDQRDALCRRGLDDIFDSGLHNSITTIIDDVRARGDQAVCDALATHDGITLKPNQLRVTGDEIDAATVDSATERALREAIDNVRRFNDALLARMSDWSIEIQPGLTAGEKVTPISSAGLFVPSGKASYPSVAYQLGVPAVVAGVPKVVVIVPPVPGGNGDVDPAVLVVCRLLGLRDVFRVNGPAGIAALGFGTNTIPRVRKVVGPGSPAVTIAQVEMQRHGLATMMLLGPTESLVIADSTARADLVAADLLIEAEHGTDSTVVLVTDSASLIDDVDTHLARQLADLPPVRAAAARSSLGDNGGAVLVDTLENAVQVANRFAAEHLQVAVDASRVDSVVGGIVNAGEILIGQHTPFSAANFVIGCPASLPTSGFAHVSSGITVETFMKRTAVARADERALRDLAPSIEALSAHEGFPAHGNAVRRRLS